jgi:hypothetical protein
VLQEASFKSGSDIYHFLPWWGLLGFIITGVESYLWGEINAVIYTYTLDYKVGLLFLGFVATLVIFTSITPFFIKRCSASMFNIAIVSQIFWSYLVELMSGDANPRSYFYFIGFFVIIVGIYIFNKFPVEYRLKLCDLQNSLISETSETSSCSAFSTADRKYTHIKTNNTLHLRASKYLNNHHV